MKRRHFLRLAGGLALGGLVGVPLYSWYVEPHWIEVVERDLPIRNLPGRLVGRTLVQISDLHVGPVVDEGYITRAMHKASALGADILAITGDFMTYRDREQLDAIRRVLGHLTPGRLATVAVLGNHDYGQNWGQTTVADELTARLTDLGYRVARNQAIELDGLTVAGLDDLWGPCFAPERVLPRLDPAEANLVLCHNPDAVDQPIWAGYQGWILCGHTHGGQCKPPFFAPPILPLHNHRYHAGAFDLGDGRRLYVNRALGYLRRVRFNARPEITVFRLSRGRATQA